MHRFLVAAVGPADADDCYQEACIAALRAYPELEHADNLRGWLLTIAQRKAIDAHRARARRPMPVADAARAPRRRRAVRADRRPAAVGARAALPEKQRMAVFLRSVADLSYADVAARSTARRTPRGAASTKGSRG